MRQHSRVARLLTAVAISATAGLASAQTPQPFPTAGTPPTAPRRPAPAAPSPDSTAQAPARPAAVPGAPPASPTDAELGAPIYPAAVFLRAYDAGRGQRYYVFGVASSFAEMVMYYRNVLKDEGNLVFEMPPTHVFEIGRFRERTMAFPPSVTIKDYTFNGTAGFPSPRPGTAPDRFPTIIQIVAAPTAVPRP